MPYITLVADVADVFGCIREGYGTCARRQDVDMPAAVSGDDSRAVGRDRHRAVERRRPYGVLLDDRTLGSCRLFP